MPISSWWYKKIIEGISKDEERINLPYRKFQLINLEETRKINVEGTIEYHNNCCRQDPQIIAAISG